MRHWFALGVDGLRLDVANLYMHDPSLRSNPPTQLNAPPANPYYVQSHVYDRTRPENLPFLARMRAVADAAGDRMLLAEISCDRQIERMAEYSRSGRLHTAYSFELLGPRLDGTHLARTVTEAGAGDAWPTWAFSNHDVVRVASRWGAAGNPRRVALLQALLLCLRGTVILYQGEELGLPHSEIPRDRLQDPEAIRFWPDHRGRDGARTPMPWHSEGVALGFSSRDGWLPAEHGHALLAVSAQQDDPTSSLAHARRMLALRQAHPAMRLGNLEVDDAKETSIILRRSHGGDRLLCAFNWGQDAIPLVADGIVLAGGTDAGKLPPDSYVLIAGAP